MNQVSASSLAASVGALDRVRVVLCRPSHPGNIGAAARAMKTMGLSRLVLVDPARFPDDEAIARAAGAEDVLVHCQVCATLDEALTGTVMAIAMSARHRNLGPAPLQAREGAAVAVDRAKEGEVALVFGNETRGLANEDVMRCQHTVFIPANPDYTSLNLGAAVQVLCYELRMAAFAERPPVVTRTVPFESPPASFDDVERFYAHLESVMVDTGFHNPSQPKRLMPKIRRLFGRAALERDEINILRGILDAVQKRLR
ncbi:RNA methyltransferase [uncultured Propionivibrio sp.]|uniref:RNA methyltransferase n=1 Tax=uncultured Propionivibrio sp. TaxID=426737 RepID=UPI0029BFCC8F|nr:RNA methyltransferase [uncultured Propionivibrio sp.]